MALIKLPRSPSLYWLAVGAVVSVHAVLVHGAATYRGYPPMDSEEILYMFIAPFLIGLPAMFDDSGRQRFRGVIAASVGMALLYGVVLANLQTATPHLGHLSGMIGVIASCWFLVLVHAIGPFFALCFSMYFIERVTGDYWPLIRRFKGSAEEMPCKSRARTDSG